MYTATSENLLNDLVRDLARQDYLGVILRGHLHIEAALDVKIRLRLSYPSAINLDDEKGLRFTQKVELAAAMGIVHKDVVPALKKLNGYRNDLAHDLSFQPGLKEARGFANLLSVEARSIYKHMQAMLDNTDGEAIITFRSCIASLYLLIEVDLAEALRLEREGKLKKAGKTGGGPNSTA